MNNLSSFIFFFLVFVFNPLSAQKPHNLQSDYLDNLAREFNLNEQDVAGVIVTSKHTSSISGVQHYYFRQRLLGIEINQANASAHILPNGQILKLTNEFITNPGHKVSGLNSPVISAKQAIEFAAAQLSYSFTEPLQLLQEDPTAVDRKSLYSNGGISLEDIPVRLMYQPVDDNTIRLAWDLSIDELGGENWWSIRVDASTGDILHKNSWTVSCNFDHPHKESCSTNKNRDHKEKETLTLWNPAMVGNYNVYPMPLESPNHGERAMVSNPDNAIASPYGWHDTNGVEGEEYTITRGNNVHAYDDIDANNSGGSSPDGGITLSFDFPINTSYSPSDPSLDAATTNLFYWSNLCHDLWYQYGFDEASGNFQENNYGNGGIGTDYCRSEAQDGSGTCNANMSTPTDGNRPRMQMYTCSDRDGDLDNGVIVHEYGHGISIRLTGGGGNSGCLNNQEQMGEGWSDWFGMMMTMEPGDAGADSRGMGTWLFGEDANGPGIRPHPYSTSMTVNPHTYDDIKTEAVPHGVGSVWCAMLWEVAWALVDDFGYDSDFYNGTSGNNMAMALVTEGLKLQPCSPGFVDGRDAILAADVALYGGANECIIWEAFAKRGLGFSASQGSSGSRSDGTEAFDMPPACLYPALSFELSSINTFEGDSPEVPPGPGECRSYTEHDIKVALSSDPSGSASVSILASGTLDNDDYDLFGSNMNFPVAGEQIATLRIYNDATIEVNEDLQLELVINNPGSTDADLGNISVMDITITTDDFAPGSPSPYEVDNAGFETGTDGYTSTNPEGGDVWARGTATDATSSSWTVPTSPDGSTYLFFANDDECDCLMSDVTLISPVFNLSNIVSTELKYDIFFEGRTYQGITETAELLISTDGGTNYTSLEAISGITGSWREEVVDLSAYDGMNNIVLAFKYSDGGGWLYGIAIDHIRVDGLLSFEPAISTELNNIDEQDVPPNAEVYFYDTNGSLIASLQNGSTDLGCMEVTIDREGTGSTPFWDYFPEHNLADKTYFFNPEFNSNNSTYLVTLYYTEAEVLAWENETGNTWAANANIVKHPTAISDVTPENPEPNGAGSIEQNVDQAGQASFSSAYYISASFNTGFSGMGVGNPGATPLPVELLNFSGTYIPNSGNQLLWRTASESNNDYFIIEHSFDGHNFTDLGKVTGKGTSTTVNNYQYLDKTARAGKHYYRLKQVDIDGKSEHSNIIVIEIDGSGQNVQVFPNPATNIITVSLSDFNYHLNEVILYNASGKKVLVKEVDLSRNASFSIDLTNLPKGAYYGELAGKHEGAPMRFRFVKD